MHRRPEADLRALKIRYGAPSWCALFKRYFMENEWIGYLICVLIIISGCIIHGLSLSAPSPRERKQRSNPSEMSDNN